MHTSTDGAISVSASSENESLQHRLPENKLADVFTIASVESPTFCERHDSRKGWFERLVTNIKTFWLKHIAFSFAQDGRTLVDHLANERTYHNWLALSNACAWVGVVILQMSKIHNVVRPDHYNMFRYKACICQVLAILILLIGTYRFFCEQDAINKTGTRANQWSLLATGVAILVVGSSLSSCANSLTSVSSVSASSS